MAHVYDFYKPELSSQYPYVDGKLSIECYLSALDRCYQVFCQKEEARGRTTSLDDFDYFCFHAPYCKLVQKSLARLQLHDFLRAGEEKSAEKFPHLQEYRYERRLVYFSSFLSVTGTETVSFSSLCPPPPPIPPNDRSVKLEETYFHRPLEQALMKNSQDAFLSKTQPTLTLANLIGNMYTPSLYGGLISLLIKYVVESSFPLTMVGVVVVAVGVTEFFFCRTVRKRRRWPENG